LNIVLIKKIEIYSILENQEPSN